MATSSVTLDTTQYVRINIGYKSMILQAHRDAVRVVVSDAKPVITNTAFHLIGDGSDPFPLNIVNTNVWALAMSDKSSLIVTETDTSYATEETTSQLVMAVNNAIDQVAFDLNAAAFSETTNIANDYELDNVEFNFSTAESKTITITSADGTTILNEPNNTDTSFMWQPSSEMAFHGGENLTVTVSQFSSVGDMDCILKVKSGTNTLLGDPYVGWTDTSGTKHGFQLAGSGRPRISTVPYRHEIASGNLAGHISLPGFGERSDVQTPIGGIGEDVWCGTATQMPHPPVAGEQMTVVSTDDEDGVAGIGALIIRIEYIDGNGDTQIEDITLDGTIPVNTVAVDIAFINHMFTTSVGSNGVAVGDVEIYKLGVSSIVYNCISAGGNKDLNTAIRVPTGKTYFLNEWHASVAGNKPVAIRLRSTDWNGIIYDGDSPVFIFKDTAFIAEGNFDRDFDPPIKIPGGSTIKVSVWAKQAGAFVSASFGGFYE